MKPILKANFSNVFFCTVPQGADPDPPNVEVPRCRVEARFEARYADVLSLFPAIIRDLEGAELRG